MAPILCISISSYGKGERTEKLVREILRYPSPDISVVVVDDHSPDDTAARLTAIRDSRLQVFCNKTNKGARENWYKTIDRGNGQYILHLLDRDWICIEYIQKIMEILVREEIKFGYIGEMFSLVNAKNAPVERYRAGEEALAKFAFTLVHPSGFLVERNTWKALSGKKKFFTGAEYGIYPHSYVFALLARVNDGVQIHYPLVKVLTSHTKYRSNFYKNNKQEVSYYWTPAGHRMELEALTRYACRHMGLPKRLLRNILQYRFHENLYYATVLYRDTAQNAIHARHYGIKVSQIRASQLIRIHMKFVWDYMMFLLVNYRDIWNLQFFLTIVRIGRDHSKKILSVKEASSFRNSYRALLSWVRMHEEQISFDDFFRWYGAKKIAVYGYGQIGQSFVKEMEQAETEISYVIDKKADYIVSDIPVITLENELQPVDVIVVTIIEEYDRISNEIRKRCKYPVISIEDAIYGSME